MARLHSCPQLEPEEERILEAVASSETIADAAERLGLSVDELASRLGSLRRRGILSHGSYKRLRVQAGLTLLCIKLSRG
ncbi:hypothetical protein D1872_329310 [compost metagenome]